MMGVKSRRFGRFHIFFDTINSEKEFLYKLMGEVIVIRAEALLHNDMVEYIAISKHFDEVGEGVMIPEYKAIMHSEKGFLRFEKC